QRALHPAPVGAPRRSGVGPAVGACARPSGAAGCPAVTKTTVQASPDSPSGWARRTMPRRQPEHRLAVGVVPSGALGRAFWRALAAPRATGGTRWAPP